MLQVSFNIISTHLKDDTSLEQKNNIEFQTNQKEYMIKSETRTPNTLKDLSVHGIIGSLASTRKRDILVLLRRRGPKCLSKWLNHCISSILDGIKVHYFVDKTQGATICFNQFELSGTNHLSSGVLPNPIQKLVGVDCGGLFLSQRKYAIEIIERAGMSSWVANVGLPLRSRYTHPPPAETRCLLVNLTLCTQIVVGMVSITKLFHIIDCCFILQVAICNVHVRHGLLMLVPEIIEVLGGMVEELEEARQRLVNEINKPPRGKRTRSGVAPPLATRATNAAWPRKGVTAPEQADTSLRESMHFPVHEQGVFNNNNITKWKNDVCVLFCLCAPGLSPGDTCHLSPATETSGIATSATEEIHSVTPGLPSSTTIATPVYRRDAQSNFPSILAVSVPFNMNVTGPTLSSDAATHAEDIHRDDMTTEGIDVPIRSEHNDPVRLSSFTMEVEELLSDFRSSPTTPASGRSRKCIPVSIGSVHNEDVEPDSLSTAAIDFDEIDLVDELDHPFILSGGKENPFTYLSSRSAKQAGMDGSASTVTGKIKPPHLCVISGTKLFLGHGHLKYEFHVFVDDGSLISEILIDHALVQKEIGFSPAEVTTALDFSYSKRVSDMKATLKCFQKFLINFEGTMFVQLNGESPILVATDMNQGCPASDAWLLLKRLEPCTSSRSHYLHHPETISLSP
ncbi:hypothetical protein RND71_036638 [Anisodus tanguticus]|uniref:RecQ-mediated genome instability protein 1 n=1 Tax=Anisodus tanguticus TaxID=243964 RepID=A0AAE1R0W5_9SOLA|nr:hypothetical protein RND71_036638 [Anisodus tanguticus]